MTQREFAETVVEAYNTGNPKILEPILSEDFIYHLPPSSRARVESECIRKGKAFSPASCQCDKEDYIELMSLFSDISNMRAGLAFRRDAKEYVVVMLTNGIYRGVLHIQHKDGKTTGLRMEDSLEGVGPVEDLIHVNEK